MKNTIIAVILLATLGVACDLADTNSIGSGDAVSGSITKFKVAKDFLYVIDGSTLRAFSLLNPSRPAEYKATEIGFGPETLFALGDFLFVGAQTGMYMFSITSPGSPTLLSHYEHVVSCDPVVANHSRAYVTLRSGGFCRGGVANANELHTIDISDSKHPELMSRYRMTHPKGLGLDGALLFVCDADRGVIVFQLDAHGIPAELTRIPGIEAQDVIALDKTLIVITKQQILQYDYSDLLDIKLLSAIQHGV